jgi:tetratricopeptide (TPR) repeat protein
LEIHDAEARAVPTSFFPYCREHQEAREIGREYHAEIVIWGNTTIAGVIPNITIVEPRSPASFVCQPDTTILKNELTHNALERIADIRLPTLTGEPLAIASFVTGLRYYEDGNYDKSLYYFKESLPETPNLYVNSAPIFFYIGIVHSAKEEYHQAIAYYTRSIEIAPNVVETYYNRGNAYVGDGDYDQAITDYKKSLELNPNYTEAYNNRGVTHRLKGDLEKAISDYKKALSLDPNHVMTFINIEIKGDVGSKTT